MTPIYKVKIAISSTYRKVSYVYEIIPTMGHAIIKNLITSLSNITAQFYLSIN